MILFFLIYFLGWTRASVYSKSGCMSSSFWWDKRDFNDNILTNYPVPFEETFYLDSGDCCPEPYSDDRYVSNYLNFIQRSNFYLFFQNSKLSK